MHDSQPSSNDISMKYGSVVPPKAWIALEASDPTKDPWWRLSAALWYGPQDADPEVAYAELAARDQRLGIAS